MQRFPVVCLAVLGLVAGCKKKEAAPTGGSGAGSAPTGSAATGGSAAAGSAAVATAAGGAVGDLPVVTDCPKSLGGAETVARTIKKACGPIVVTSTYEVKGSLTLEAGVVLKFQPDAGIEVGYGGPAKLIVQGGDAPDQRVVFTSNGDKAAGVWKGLSLYDGADRSSITGLDVEYAGTDDHPAVMIQKASDITFTKSSIKHAKGTGLQGRDQSTFAAFAGNTFDDIGKIAMSVEPAAVGGLAPGNTFPKDAFIDVQGGKVTHDATWRNAGAPLHIAGEIGVDTQGTPTTLTIADATLVFAGDVELAVGYGSKGKLIVTGPAVFTSLDDKPGTWKGIRVYDAGEATIDKATIRSGGTDTEGALLVKRSGKLTLGAVTFKDNKAGLGVEDGGVLTAPQPLTFSGNALAARLSPSAFGGLGSANVYDDGQVIEVTGGKLVADTTWNLQPKAVVKVTEELGVSDSHTLTIAPGTTLAFKTGIELAVGYGSVGTLKAVGKPDAPITLGAIVKGDQWNGVKLYDQARSVELTQVVLTDVAGDAGVIGKRDSVGKLDHVSCAGCAATVAPECGAKLDTASAVTAGAGTKVAVKKPEGC